MFDRVFPMVTIRMEPPGSPDASVFRVGDVDLAGKIVGFAIDANANHRGGIPQVRFDMGDKPVDFEAPADVHLHFQPPPLLDFLRSIDPKWLRAQVDQAGYAEHPVDTVIDVLLRLAKGDAGVRDDAEGDQGPTWD